MNKRLKDIENSLNNLNFSNNSKNNFKNLQKKYENELTDYTFINNLGEFSTLELKGSIRYINKYSEELKYGGLLIKIYNKEFTDNWYAMLKKPNNKRYNIPFHNNYIFYKKTKEDQFKDWAELFIKQIDDGEYNIN
jgi:hypothetical protein